MEKSVTISSKNKTQTKVGIVVRAVPEWFDHLGSLIDFIIFTPTIFHPKPVRIKLRPQVERNKWIEKKKRKKK